jgi:hypothetical protein
VKWLCENQGQKGCILMSTSKPISEKYSLEDKNLQPPHRQTKTYYERIANYKDGQFKVTMESPSVLSPKPTVIEITDHRN